MAHRSEKSLFPPNDRVLYEQSLAILLNARHENGWLSLLPPTQKFTYPDPKPEDIKQERNN